MAFFLETLIGGLMAGIERCGFDPFEFDTVFVKLPERGHSSSSTKLTVVHDNCTDSGPDGWSANSVPTKV